MTRSIIFIAANLAIRPLVAQLPVACAGQLVPLKPVSIFCPGAAAVCVTDASGTRGHWVWGCPAGNGAAPHPNVDPGLLDSIAHPLSPQTPNPLDVAIQAERLRELRLQNQQLEQQLRAESAASTPVPTIDPAIELQTAYHCGTLKGRMEAMEAMGNAEGASETRDAMTRSGCDRIVPSAVSAGSVNPPLQARTPDGLPSRWMSLTSGTTKSIRRDGDRLHVETVLPDDARQAGCSQVADLEKRGDLYAGTAKFQCVCQYQKFRIGRGYEVFTNQYSTEDRIEITKISPTSIEGNSAAPSPGAKFDCEKGSYSKPPIQQPFVWIPE